MVELEEYPPHVEWQAAVELGESSPAHALNILSPEAVSDSLLNALQPRRPKEIVLWQMVLTPTVTTKKPSSTPNRPLYIKGGWLHLLTGLIEEDKDDLGDGGPS